MAFPRRLNLARPETQPGERGPRGLVSRVLAERSQRSPRLRRIGKRRGSRRYRSRIAASTARGWRTAWFLAPLQTAAGNAAGPDGRRRATTTPRSGAASFETTATSVAARPGAVGARTSVDGDERRTGGGVDRLGVRSPLPGAPNAPLSLAPERPSPAVPGDTRLHSGTAASPRIRAALQLATPLERRRSPARLVRDACSTDGREVAAGLSAGRSRPRWASSSPNEANRSSAASISARALLEPAGGAVLAFFTGRSPNRHASVTKWPRRRRW